jgi:co-chaperonin GroES (HSP10)
MTGVVRQKSVTTYRSSAADALEPPQIKIGDRVRWNNYTGRVLSVNGESALVEERDNVAFGRAVKWRLVLSSLTRVGSC